ncbi:MAG: MFS transporter [Actinomycetota bacterium]
MIAMVFGMSNALFPAVAREFGGPAVLGVLYAAPSGGALIASLTSGWTGKVRRHGLATYLAVVGWGISLILFGLAPSLWFAVLTLALAGGADMISAIFRHTILQTAAPPHLVGRLSGLELTVVASGPAVGDLEAGALAALTNIRFSIVAGGFACLIGVAIMAVALPEFARYDAQDPTP